MAEPVTIKLTKPIIFGSETISELTLRPIKGKDYRRLKATSGMGIILELAGYLSGQVTQVIDELEGEDLQEVILAVSVFMGSSREIGIAPSES